MTILQSLILGIIQGLTEFLPISSSAHLVLIPFLFGWKLAPNETFIFDVLVQVGTLLAVIIYFWKDLWTIAAAVLAGLKARTPWQSPESRLGWLILLATIPAGLLGLVLKDLVEAAFNSPETAAVFLLVTALLLVIAERVGQRTRNLPDFNWKDAVWIGAFQSLAVFPGISRSGSTITGAMLRNSKRPAAARFSFLMSIPIMLAAGGLAVADLMKLPSLGQYLPIITTGFIVSAVVGYFSIHWLIRYLSNHPLYVFAIYCAALGIIVLTIAFFT